MVVCVDINQAVTMDMRLTFFNEAYIPYIFRVIRFNMVFIQMQDCLNFNIYVTIFTVSFVIDVTVKHVIICYNFGESISYLILNFYVSIYNFF